MIPCKICDAPIANDGTRRRDRCWELERRIHADPQLTRQILAKIAPQDESPPSPTSRDCDCPDDADCQSLGCADCRSVINDGTTCESCGSTNLIAYCLRE